MKLRPLSGSQRGVIVVALGLAIYVFGQWLLETWEFGSRANFGWVAYAPLSTSLNTGQLRILHPWVILLFWLILIAVWLFASLILLQRHPEES
jgi:uncharacterized membrane protein YwaF